jgi:protein SCO1/2
MPPQPDRRATPPAEGGEMLVAFPPVVLYPGRGFAASPQIRARKGERACGTECGSRVASFRRQNPMSVRIVVLAALAFVIGGLGALLILPSARERMLPNATTVGQALVGGPFTLTDQTGRRVTDADYRGKYMLVMFGFTHCPDVCPSGLQVLSAALEQLGPKADKVVPIFISVDHERDTPEQLAMYVQSFHPHLRGLTGSAEDIAAAARAYRVYYKKVVDEKSTAGFTYDHSALIYLMGPDGKYIAHFSHAAGPDAIAERLAKIL